MTSEGTSKRLRTTTSSRGTECYRAPELLREECGGYNNKVDIWSMGCILQELATGSKPFKNDWAVGEYYRSQGPHEIRTEFSAQGVTQGLSSLIKSMLERDPSLRPGAHDLYQRFRSNYSPTITNPDIPTISSHPVDVGPDVIVRMFASSSVSSVCAIAVSPREHGPSSISQKLRIVLVDAAKGTTLPLLNRTDRLTSMAVGVDESNTVMLAASDSWNRKIIIWNAQTGKELMQMQHQRSETAIFPLTFNHLGDRLAWGSERGNIVIRTISLSGKSSRIFPYETYIRNQLGVISLIFHRDNVRLFAAQDRIIRLFDTLMRTQLYEFEFGWFMNHNSCNAIHLRQTELYIRCNSKNIVLDSDTGAVLATYPPIGTRCMAISQCCSWHATAELGEGVLTLHHQRDIRSYEIHCNVRYAWFVGRKCYALGEDRIYIIDCGRL